MFADTFHSLGSYSYNPIHLGLSIPSSFNSAIENLCYCVGVNRVGTDGNGHAYSGDSAVINAAGEVLWTETALEATPNIELDKKWLDDFRTTFPAWKDADGFGLVF